MASMLAEYSFLVMLWVLLFGLAVGSFLNVVIYRLPIMLEKSWFSDCRELLDIHPAETEDKSNQTFNLIVPRSACPSCGHAITAWENIPLISYLVLRGRCSECAHPISIRYPLTEAFTGVMAVLSVWVFGFGYQALAAFVLCSALIAMSLIDLQHKLLPDNITLPLLWLGLLLNSFALFTDLQSAVWGAALGYGVFWLVFQLFKLLTGKEGMGYGDFKLLAALGAWLGWQYLAQIILLSSMIALVAAVLYLLITRQSQFPKIPYGPFLSCAGGIALFYGAQINHAYLAWAGLL
ncbi:MAG: A24 family peptidase [gamma proteobacterium symbiont of Bathyaustriella thionipta]|nr:A24 family peptidase [gamma proteobacterium symbiont of Bathyaustriella thionipta]